METVNQENQATESAEKTFTQAELDAIVSDRLKRDRAKYADYDALKEKATRLDELEEASKTELQKITEKAQALQQELDGMKQAESLRTMRDSIAAETGVPSILLTAGTEEECRAQAQAVLTMTKTGYPAVRDAGEANGNLKGTPKQQFSDWANQVFG